MTANLDIAINKLDYLLSSARALNRYQARVKINQNNCNTVTQMLALVTNHLQGDAERIKPITHPSDVFISGKGEPTKNDVNGNDHFSVFIAVGKVLSFSIDYVLVRHACEWEVFDCSTTILECDDPTLRTALEDHFSTCSEDIAEEIAFDGYDLWNTPTRPSIDAVSMNLIELMAHIPESAAQGGCNA
ncbi:hypothetical protein VIBNISOn1_1050041 [Vibrio nigripulchritudo SOn1]|uniref:Uncharacterized protein n=1 Tax=Vibrio nigripulchritudo SOn1 TaxID=1238450 RepID=A0AAV2VIG3_9VIBR|nr:hypothetical protein [Vibrio nigripulchritudo]CCO44215.1 hypothetical protein VIBNISOn1_1050041 [Vibrio nigripulchritudo SOn1]